jgi:hypothetical protein
VYLFLILLWDSLDFCYKECLLTQITCRLLICYKLIKGKESEEGSI